MATVKKRAGRKPPKSMSPRHLLRPGTKVRAYIQRSGLYVNAKTVDTVETVNGTWVRVRTLEDEPRVLKVRPSQMDPLR